MAKKEIDLTTVGGRIKAKRLETGLTQGQSADKLYVKFSMISSYECSGSGIGIENLKLIANALGCSASYLLEGVEATLNPEEEELLKIYKTLKSDAGRVLAMKQMKAILEVGM